MCLVTNLAGKHDTISNSHINVTYTIVDNLILTMHSVCHWVLILVANVLCGVTCCSSATQPLRWISRTNSIIPVDDLYGGYTEYNSNVSQDCIFVLGGYHSLNQVFCYNITSDHIYPYLNTSHDIFGRAQGSWWIGNTLWFNSYDGIYTLDFDTNIDIPY